MPATRRLLLGAAVTGLVAVAGCSGTHATATRSASTTPSSTAVAPTSTAASTSARPTPTRTTSARPRRSSSAPSSHPATHSASHHAASSGASLPLGFPTGGARQVVTVTAPSYGSTVGTLQRWSRTGSGWHRVGAAVTAHLGSDGLSAHPSESRSATPVGSFTLTQAFGHDPDPGTRLPYLHTTPADWWISQSGPLYNTLQQCSSGCSFTQGDPNEHLYDETPFYNYAVVIDYNTRNAPGGVQQGAGSAFFLHVTDGSPTAGCVSIPQGDELDVLRWLNPHDRPRIMIGVQ